MLDFLATVGTLTKRLFLLYTVTLSIYLTSPMVANSARKKKLMSSISLTFLVL